MDYLVIPVEIVNSPFPDDYQQILNLIFNGSSIETGWESVSTYYYKSSYGQLNMSFEIADKYMTQYDATYYENLGLNEESIIMEVLNGLDYQIDFFSVRL